MLAENFLDDLLSLPDLMGGMTSPNGKWVAWTWYKTGPAADVYFAPVDGSAAPLALTSTLDNSLIVSWAPDSKSVLLMQDHDGDERYRLYRVYLEQPGQLELLTDQAPNYFLRGGELNPSGSWLVYAANYDAATGLETEVTLIYRQDLETGERRVLARPQKPGTSRPDLNLQGTYILYNRKDLDPSGNQIWLVDIEGREDREILNFGAAVKVAAHWFPDGERAMVVAENGNYRRVGVWHHGSDSLSWIIDDPSRNIENAFVPIHSPFAVIIEVAEARIRASLYDFDTREETPLPQVSGNLIPIAPVVNALAERGEWVGRYYSSQQPGDLVRFAWLSPPSPVFDSLTRVWERTALTPEDLQGAEDFRWKSVDGLEIQGWLWRAKEEPVGTIIYIHGGPTAYTEDRLFSNVQYWVAEGFNVMAPNYRGSTGFSLAFQEAIKEDGWGGREQADIATGIEALIEAGIAERYKVGVTGTSYGGYSAWCLITRYPPELVAASSPICGMTDLVVDYETTRPDLRPYSEAMLGGRPDQLPEKYYERSPLNFVENIKGELLIVQGLQDPNVTPENLRVVTEVLDRSGIHYEVLAFEDEGHGIGKPKNQRILFPRQAEFFKRAFSQAGGAA